MLKKTMTYTDYNGESVTEDFYFSMSKAELIEMEMLAGEDGLRGKMEKIVKETNREEILKTFREIILAGVGRRSEDGRRFIKSPEIREEFSQTPAFSDLLVEFYTDPSAAALFIAGMVPSDMAETIQKAIDSGELDLSTKSDDAMTKDNPEKTWRDFSRQELLEMSKDEFDRLVTMKPTEMPKELLAVAMQRKNDGE